MVIDTKYLIKISTYARRKKITRQAVWHRIHQGVEKEGKDYVYIDGEVFFLSNKRVIYKKEQEEFKKSMEEQIEFINTF